MYPNREMRFASIKKPESLRRALEGVIAVINCAGPFLDSALPLIEAALRMGVHYLDITVEQCVLTTFKRFASPALKTVVSILPAIAFFGGLADLLATAAMLDWESANVIDIGIALDSWMRTAGTRLTGKRNTSRRLTFFNKELVPISEPIP